MNRLLTLALVLSVLPIATAAESPKKADTTLERYVGTWRMDLATHAETFGDRSGPGEGTMVCAWGQMRAWVDCNMDAVYEGLGPYALKIVLHRMAEDGAIGAFVTNSFGGGRLYVGRWQDNSRLVFNDAWTDPRRTWQHQVTTYTFVGDDTIRYSIEVSTDSETFHPHSSGTYSRAD